jgi:hypothetical protein
MGFEWRAVELMSLLHAHAITVDVDDDFWPRASADLKKRAKKKASKRCQIDGATDRTLPRCGHRSSPVIELLHQVRDVCSPRLGDCSTVGSPGWLGLPNAGKSDAAFVHLARLARLNSAYTVENRAVTPRCITRWTWSVSSIHIAFSTTQLPRTLPVRLIFTFVIFFVRTNHPSRPNRSAILLVRLARDR